MRDHYISCDDHYRPLNATWACDLCTFSGCLVKKNDIVRHIVTQKASLLPVATVFIDIHVWTPFCSQGGGLIRKIKLPIRKIKLPMQEL